MFLANFDFLSSPPQIYFLCKRTNKTILGGILFLIYIIIMIIISVFYTVDYCLNDKYDIRYSIYKNINHKEELNYNFNFKMDMTKITKNLEPGALNENFFLLDSDFSIINENTIINKTPEEMTIYIVYFCLFNCSYEYNIDLAYINNISYIGYKIDHQNDKKPLETNNDNFIFNRELYFSFNKSTLFEIYFEIIKYKEEKGLLGLFEDWLNKKNEHSCVDILSIEKTIAERTIDVDFGELFPGEYKILSIIHFNKQYEQISEYIRTKKSVLDVLANIGSLFSTFLNIFCFFFNFYSRNQKNYEIMKKLLENQNIVNNSNIKICHSRTIKLENENITFRKNKKYYSSLDKQSIDTSKSVPFKLNDNKISNKYLENKNKNKNKDESFQLPEINIFHFFFKKINFKSKYMKTKREIINLCNSILFKYTSVEVILYNQIIFENILKDYKWNDPYLRKLYCNALIKKLKSVT